LAAAIFNSGTVKLLKNTMRFKDNTEFTSINLISTTNTKVLTNKTLTAPLITAGSTINLTAAGTLDIATNAGANNITIGQNTSTVVVAGNLQVDGTTTTVNSATMDVTDSNISVNVSGNQAAADANDAGITVEMSDATNAILHYDSTLTSKWALGLVGSTVEIVDVSSSQVLSNKIFTSPDINDTSADHQYIYAVNELTANRNITLPLLTGDDEFVFKDHAVALTNKTVVVASNTITTASSGNLTATELNAALAELQSDIDTRIVFDTISSSGVFTAVADSTHLVDTSGGVSTITLPAAAADVFVRIIDKGNANTNNITITPASGTINGQASWIINSDYGAINICSDGSDWFIA